MRFESHTPVPPSARGARARRNSRPIKSPTWYADDDETCIIVVVYYHYCYYITNDNDDVIVSSRRQYFQPFPLLPSETTETITRWPYTSTNLRNLRIFLKFVIARPLDTLRYNLAFSTTRLHCIVAVNIMQVNFRLQLKRWFLPRNITRLSLFTIIYYQS